MRIGEKIVAEKDIKIQTLISGEISYIKKGTEGIITSVGSIYWNSDCITLTDNEVRGYDKNNIAKFIVNYLTNRFSKSIWNELEENTDISKEEIREEIEHALDEIF